MSRTVHDNLSELAADSALLVQAAKVNLAQIGPGMHRDDGMLLLAGAQVQATLALNKTLERVAVALEAGLRD